MPSKPIEMTPELAAAVKTFRSRQARYDHPDGCFDNANRWYPSDDERCDCCDYIRSPSRVWPNSLNTHCRSAEHVANLFNVDVTLLRRAARAADKANAPV